VVLQLTREDIKAQVDGRLERKPDAIFITGDIAFSGGSRSPQEYPDAAAWLRALVADLGLQPADVYLVPGNHDIPRVPTDNRNLARLVRELRSGSSIDDAIADSSDASLLQLRTANYLQFLSGFNATPASATAPGTYCFWFTRLASLAPFPITLVGLNTAMLAADDEDARKLQVGQRQLIQTLLQANKTESLVIVLSHHPCSWLSGWRQSCQSCCSASTHPPARTSA
jgi:3',5'-cyclic AMP phosphodiesterase CpdA